MREAERGTAAEGQGRRWWRRRWLAWTVAVIGIVAIVALFGLEWGMRQVQPMLRRKVVDACGAVSFSGGAGPAFAVDEQGRDGDGRWVADSLSGWADEAGCEAECAADADGGEL